MTRPVWDMPQLWFPDEPEPAVIFGFGGEAPDDVEGHYQWTAPDAPPGMKLSSVWTIAMAAGFVSAPQASWQDIDSGEVLDIFVGGVPDHETGAGGYNGGGDGHPGAEFWYQGTGGYGASDIRQGGDTLDDRILVDGGAGRSATVTYDGEQMAQFRGDWRYGPLERHQRWYPVEWSESRPWDLIAPDHTNVIHFEAGTPGQGGNGGSIGGAIRMYLEWPNGDRHDGTYEEEHAAGYAVTEDHTQVCHPGAGGGGYVGGNSGYVTFLEVGGIMSIFGDYGDPAWLPANYWTDPAGGPDGPWPTTRTSPVTPDQYPPRPAWWRDIDEFGEPIPIEPVDLQYWDYPHGNQRDEPWPYTFAESEILAQSTAYASTNINAWYHEGYTGSGGTDGSDFTVHAGDTSAPWESVLGSSLLTDVNLPPTAREIAAPIMEAHRWDSPGTVIIIYGFVPDRHWNVGHVGTTNPARERL